jgi:hypothetical protein
MESDDTGVAVDELVSAIKNTIRLAGLSDTNSSRDLCVASIRLVLHVVGTVSAGGGIDFRIPVLGMKLKIGSTITKRDTHRIEINMVPSGIHQHEIRDSAVETVLLDAVETIRNLIGHAADGDDPFALETGSVELGFAVTRQGSIMVGLNGELRDEIVHTLRMVLMPQGRPGTKPGQFRPARP